MEGDYYTITDKHNAHYIAGDAAASMKVVSNPPPSNAQWYLTWFSGDVFSLKNRQSGLALDATKQGLLAATGSAHNQHWIFSMLLISVLCLTVFQRWLKLLRWM